MSAVESETGVLEAELPESEARLKLRDQLLRELPKHFDIQRQIDQIREGGDKRDMGGLYEFITENEEHWLRYLAEAASDEAISLWAMAREITDKNNYYRDRLDGFQRGVVTQVAVLKALKAAGHDATLANASQNMAKVDIILEAETPVQVKGRLRGKKPIILKCDDISLPAVEVQKSGISHWFNAQDERDMNSFSVKVENLSRVLGRKIVGYMVYVPERFFDRHTGEPAADLVEAFKEALAALPETKELSYTANA